ncbi:MAG: hypothetical protein MJ246_05150 [Clostridia bacterium]|nr:hypothetical protein [Clostridia bacterium]
MMDKTGLTNKDSQDMRDEILGTKPEDIKGYSKLLDDVIKNSVICSLGNERKLQKSKTPFKTLRTLKGKNE